MKENLIKDQLKFIIILENLTLPLLCSILIIKILIFLGSSPEILVRLRNGEVTIRPIAGTRPRGKNNKEDKKYELDLLKDKKELAEHLMLLDLGRNDVGKVSKVNSVKVTEKFKVERYSHVMHIVSNVIGKFNNKFLYLKPFIRFSSRDS